MNIVKEKIKKGEKVIGTFFELGGQTAVEALGIAGLDFIIIDCEHGPFDVESAMEFIRAAELKNLTPFVRVKDTTRPSILKMLDIGAKALIIPCIETVEQVEKIVEFGKYYPLGKRGFFFSRVGGYGNSPDAASIDRYMEINNENTIIIPQCETLGCLENIETIVEMAGVDGIFVGPFDLSISLGIPGQFKDQKFVDAIERVKSACKNAGKPLFIYTVNAEAANEYLSQGMDGAAISTDVNVYIDAYKDLLGKIRR